MYAGLTAYEVMHTGKHHKWEAWQFREMIKIAIEGRLTISFGVWQIAKLLQRFGWTNTGDAALDAKLASKLQNAVV
jgi:hypothetical protein